MIITTASIIPTTINISYSSSCWNHVELLLQNIAMITSNASTMVIIMYYYYYYMSTTTSITILNPKPNALNPKRGASSSSSAALAPTSSWRKVSRSAAMGGGVEGFRV